MATSKFQKCISREKSTHQTTALYLPQELEVR
jgi:hypothetical protein